MKIDKQQIKKLQATRRRLGISDEDWRAIIRDYGHESTTELTMEQGVKLHKWLQRQAARRGAWQKPYENLRGRAAEFASPAQLRMIAAMWAEKSFLSDAGARKRALDKFVRRITGVARLEWLLADQVPKVVKAIKAMRGGHHAKGNRVR